MTDRVKPLVALLALVAASLARSAGATKAG